MGKYKKLKKSQIKSKSKSKSKSNQIKNRKQTKRIKKEEEEEEEENPVTCVRVLCVFHVFVRKVIVLSCIIWHTSGTHVIIS
jgi:uncharacterized protein (UPF0305 family)